MRVRNARDRRARKGRYFLRDLAGFADVDRLLATDIGERLAPEVADDDAATDASGRPSHDRPQPGEGMRRRK